MSRFNFDGYKIETWLKENKDSLKLLISGVSGIATAIVSKLDPVYSVSASIAVTGLTKLVVDGLDYWFSK